MDFNVLWAGRVVQQIQTAILGRTIALLVFSEFGVLAETDSSA